MDTSRKKYDFVYNFTAAGKNITEVINVKERGNQLFKDKFVLVMLVLGLLTIVAAAGAVRIQKGRENIGESPYLEIEDPDHVIAGDSNAGAESGGDTLAGELAASGDEAGNGEPAGDSTAVGLADNENAAGTGADHRRRRPSVQGGPQILQPPVSPVLCKYTKKRCKVLTTLHRFL